MLKKRSILLVASVCCAVFLLGSVQLFVEESAAADPPPPIVYVVAAIDTETDDNHEKDGDYHTVFNVDSYDRSGSTELAEIMGTTFRNSRTDSFGTPFKMTWFIEMDDYINQGQFTDGTPFDYLTIYDLLMDNWGSEVDAWGDEIAYHHHFYEWGGSKWERVKYSLPDDYDYHNEALAAMVVDGGFFPSSFRSGWLWTTNELQAWIDSWMMVDYSNFPGERWMFPDWTDAITSWIPYHPSPTNYLVPGSMDHWIARCDGIPVEQEDVDSAFAEAQATGEPVIYCWFGHNRDDMDGLIDGVHDNLVTASAEYGISFQYATAHEAIQAIAGCTDVTPPMLNVSSSGDTYTITSNEALWGDHPFAAAKYIGPSGVVYTHTAATSAGANTWQVTWPDSWEVTIVNEAYDAFTATAESGTGAANVIDEAPSFWDSTPQEVPAWVQVDLGEIRTVGGLSIHFYDSDSRQYTYYVEGSTDGTTWAEIVPSSTAHGLATHTIDPAVPLRYARVTVTDNSSGANDYAHVREIEVYSGPPSHEETVYLQQVGAGALDLCGNGAVSTGIITRAIRLEKSVDPDVIYGGQEVTYTYKVTNPGDDPLSGVVVEDDQCDPISGPTELTGNGDDVLDPGEEWEYSCSMALSVDTVNVATATGTASSGEPITWVDSVSVDVIDPGIFVDKTASAPTVRVGENAIYTVTVTNTGDDPLANVTPVDDRCTLVGPTKLNDNGDDLLDVHEEWIYTCTMQIGEPVTNHVEVIGMDSLANPVTDTAEASVDTIDPQMTVVKTVAPAVVDSGDVVTYTVVVTNTGDDPLGDVTAIDTQCALGAPTKEGGNQDDALDPGEVWTYSCSTAVVADTDNTVSVTAVDSLGGIVGPETDTAQVDVLPELLLDVSSNWDRIPEPSASVTFTVRVTNVNLIDDVNVLTLTDSVLGDLNGLGSCSLPQNLPGGGTFECAFSVMGSGNAGDTLEHTITVGGEDGQGNGAFANDDVTLEISDVPPLVDVQVTELTPMVRAGDVAEFEVTIANLSVEPVTVTELVDSVLGDLMARCGLPDVIAVGDQFDCTVTETLFLDHVSTITATVEDDEGGVASDWDGVSVDVIFPAIQVLIDASPSPAMVGETVTYTYTVENVGDVVLSGISVMDNPFGSIRMPKDSLAPGESMSKTVFYSVSGSDWPDPLFNQVTATGEPPVGPSVSDSDEITVTLELGPAGADHFIYLPLVLNNAGGE